MNKSINKLPKSLVEVSITADPSEIQPLWDKTLQRLSLETEVPGFRKGSAPVGLLEQHLGSKLQDEFLKDAMSSLLISVLQENKVVPIDYPKYELISFQKGGPLSFKATVTERPEVKVGEYKSIRLTKPPVKSITDADVDKVIEDLFKRWRARMTQTPASTSNGSAPQVQNNAVPSTFNPASTGTLSFDNTSQNQPPVAPAISDAPDDKFAQAVGALGLTDLKTKIKADLENEAKYNNELDFEESILQEVEKRTTVEVPDILIEDELNRMLISLQKRVSEMGMLLEDYLKTQNETLEGIKGKWKEQALKNVRMELGLAEVARLENINITDLELQAEIDKIQDGRLKAQFDSQEPRLHLRHSLRQIKTLDLLKKINAAS